MTSLLAVALAGIAGAVVSRFSSLPFAGILIGGILYCAIRFPKSVYGMAVIIVMFSGMWKASLPQLTDADEFLVVLMVISVVIRWAAGFRLYSVPGALPLSTLLVLGTISALLAGVPIHLALLDSFLVLKGFVFYATGVQLNWTVDDVRKICKIASILGILIVLLMVVNIGLGSVWYTHFSITKNVAVRDGILNPIGPFGHPGAAAQAMTLFASAFLAYYMLVTRSSLSLSLFALSLPLQILNLRRKAAVALIALLGIVLMSAGRTVRRRVIYAAIAFLPIIIYLSIGPVQSIITATNKEYFSNETPAARVALYDTAPQLANENFPFGAGFARYGTSVAFKHYSDIYYINGFNRIYGLEPVTGNFATDTFWPAIIGETGWLGLILFVLSMLRITWVASYSNMRSKSYFFSTPTDANFLKLMGTVTFAWSIEFLIESFAAPAYSSPPLYLLLFGAFAVSISVGRVTERSPIISS